MKSTELIKGKWYVLDYNYGSILVKHLSKVGTASEVINNNVYKSDSKKDLKRDYYSYGSKIKREATIDDFPDEFKYLFNESISEPNYEVY